MPATINATKQAIVDALVGNAGLRAYTNPPETISSPMAVVMFDGADYHQGGNAGGTVYTFRVQLLVGRMALRASMDRLGDYASYSGDESVRAAIEQDETLGSVVSQVWVRTAENIGLVSAGENEQYLAVDFIVEVYA